MDTHKTPLEKVLARTAQAPSGCLEWQGSRHPAGHGQIRINRVLLWTHRIVWEAHHGPIPDGMVVRHKCDNPSCCEVSHLELGTQRQNRHDEATRQGPRKGNSSGLRGCSWHKASQAWYCRVTKDGETTWSIQPTLIDAAAWLIATRATLYPKEVINDSNRYPAPQEPRQAVHRG